MVSVNALRGVPTMSAQQYMLTPASSWRQDHDREETTAGVTRTCGSMAYVYLSSWKMVVFCLLGFVLGSDG